VSGDVPSRVPSSACRSSLLTPTARKRCPSVWRMSWKRRRGKPARVRALRHAWLDTRVKGCPLYENTYSDTRSRPSTPSCLRPRWFWKCCEAGPQALRSSRMTVFLSGNPMLTVNECLLTARSGRRLTVNDLFLHEFNKVLAEITSPPRRQLSRFEFRCHNSMGSSCHKDCIAK
jgi:hypothetical protein